MGAELSHSAKLKTVWIGNKQSLVAKWQQRQLLVQHFGVARHAERADSIYAFVNGQRWTALEDSHQWPFDPPLSDSGMEAAQDMGRNVQRYVAEQASPVHVLISSPYFRCVQTAAMMCKVLGPSVRLIIDRALGEVYGPSVMGPKEPKNPVRGFDQTLAFCQAHGVACQTRIIGRWPSWPEQFQDARWRYATRFLSFLEKSTITRRNFILVTHADGVGVTLSVMPSQLHQVVENVDFGGHFLAKRSRSEHSVQCGGLSSIVPTAAKEQEEQGLDDLGLGRLESQPESACTPSRSGLPCSAWTMDSACRSQCALKDSSTASPSLHPPRASDGWEVDLFDITMRKRRVAAKFKKRVRALAQHGLFTEDKIEQLLGGMSTKPLGREELEKPSEIFLDKSGPLASGCSFSTYLFGASEVGSVRDLEGMDDMDCLSRSSRLDTSTTMGSSSSEVSSPRHSTVRPACKSRMQSYQKHRKSRKSSSFSITDADAVTLGEVSMHDVKDQVRNAIAIHSEAIRSRCSEQASSMEPESWPPSGPGSPSPGTHLQSEELVSKQGTPSACSTVELHSPSSAVDLTTSGHRLRQLVAADMCTLTGEAQPEIQPPSIDIKCAGPSYRRLLGPDTAAAVQSGTGSASMEAEPKSVVFKAPATSSLLSRRRKSQASM